MGAKDYPFSFNNFEEAAFEFEPLRGLDSKISNRETASDFTWTLGIRPCFQTSGTPVRFGLPQPRPAVKHGLDNS